MAQSLNKVELIGNLGKDPEIRTLPGGGKVANLTIATSEKWKDGKTGEMKERTEWHRVVVWNEPLVGVIEKYTKKGDKLYICGQNETRKWGEGDDTKYTTEVVLRPYRSELILLGGNGGGASKPATKSEYESEPTAKPGGTINDLDDEIPF